MLVYLHIGFALAGLIISGYNLLRPSSFKQIAGYISIIATTISGTFLIITTNASLVPACLSGLAYLSVVSLCLFLSHKRLQSTE